MIVRAVDGNMLESTTSTSSSLITMSTLGSGWKGFSRQTNPYTPSANLTTSYASSGADGCGTSSAAASMKGRIMARSIRPAASERAEAVMNGSLGVTEGSDGRA